jgi:hypothetical protein
VRGGRGSAARLLGALGAGARRHTRRPTSTPACPLAALLLVLLPLLTALQTWLCVEGSPHSHIERCEFSRERPLQRVEFEVFERRPNVP